MAACTNSQSANNPSDPLRNYQWYLYSTGGIEAAAFATISGGQNHANILAAHNELGITGKCITVNVIDTGLQLDHPDLRTDQSKSYDYYEEDNNPQPIGDSEGSGDHGTSVAGIIGMKKNNGIGGVGVAPGVTLIGHAFVERKDATPAFADYRKMMGLSEDDTATATELAQVYNQSFGSDDLVLDHSASYNYFAQQIYERGTRVGRQGKGYIYIKAAGNGYKYRYTINAEDEEYKTYSCNSGQTSCEISSHDYDNTLPENIVVSATNAAGKLSSYSTTGSGIWLSAPGGEFGYGSGWNIQRTPSQQYLLQPAMVTTDVTGCESGYSRKFNEDQKVRNIFEYDMDNNSPHPLNSNCDYTSTFNGTSSATPVVSGVVALMLEANPDLGWRDVKHILATTSSRIDPEKKDYVVKGVIIDHGWTQNAAGHWFSNWYGFGQVDGYEAALAARDYSNDMGEYVSHTPAFDPSLDMPIGQGSNSGMVTTMMFEGDIIIESVILDIKIKDGSPFNLTFGIESPMGTKTSLLPYGSAYYPIDLSYSIDASFLTNALYEENAKGTWTLYIYDLHDASTDSGPFDTNGTSILEQWSLTINGHSQQ